MPSGACDVRRAIGSALRGIPRFPGGKAIIHYTEWEDWLHEVDLPKDKPSEYEWFGQDGKQRDISNFVTTLAKRGSGSKELAAAFYYRLHYHVEDLNFAWRVDEAAFGEGKKFNDFNDGKPVFEAEPDSSREPKLVASIKSESKLHYSNPIIKVLGRDDEQKRLRNFLQEEKKGFEWLQLAGVGGQGKSRLAFDLVSKCPQNWYAGFLPEKELGAFKARWEHWQPAKPTLIVIDYILGHEPDVKETLQTLAKRSDEFTVAVRMLLVERQRWDRGELVKQQSQQSNGDKYTQFVPDHGGKAHWFLQLNDRSGGDDVHLANTMHGKNGGPDEGVIELEQLSIKRLGDITRQVAKELGHKGPINDKDNEEFLGRIDKQGRPLYAYFLAHAINADGFQSTWTLEDLLKETLLREYHQRWKSSFKTKPPAIGQNTKSMRYAVLATMIDGLECKKNLKAAKGALILCDGTRGDPALNSTLVPALLPDILGEYFVLLSFEKAMSAKSLAQKAWELSPAKMASFLQRCVQDFPSHDEVFDLLDLEPKQPEGQAAYAGVSATVVHYLISAEYQQFPQRLLEALNRAAKAKHVHAMSILGYLALEGIGMPRDPEAAADWFRNAAEAGDSAAMINLGVCYFQGAGVDLDHTKAVKWYREAAEVGDRYAMKVLADCYEQGRGVDVDWVEAMKWYRMAAEAGDSRTMFKLGVYYEQGRRTDVDLAEALKWYRMAAEVGHNGAMSILGEYLEEGRGVDADPDEALKWRRKAAEAGNSDAKEILVPYPDLPGLDQDDPAIAEFAANLRNEKWPISPLIEGNWAKVSKTESQAAICALTMFSLLNPSETLAPIALRTCPLSFYPGFQLLEVLFEHSDELRVACLLMGEDGTALILNENSPVTDHVNALGHLCLDDAHAAHEYLRFFCIEVSTPNGPFRVIDSLDKKLFVGPPNSELWEKLSMQVKPLTLTKETSDDFFFSATVKYGTALFHVNFKVSRNENEGHVDMMDDTPIQDVLPFYQEGFDGVFRFCRAPNGDE